MSRSPIIVFAQVPPPEHGQSRMVAEMLRVLRDSDLADSVHHVDARFSVSIDDVGERSLRKLLLSFRFVLKCLQLRITLHDPALYYVPGPVKWNPVIRDWLLLAILRPWFPRLIFHWHAVGQGEWAHGSPRLRLPGPRWLDLCGRAISRALLRAPAVSIAVSRYSTNDARAISSRQIAVIPNGIADPWPDFNERIRPMRIARAKALADDPDEPIRLLFLSRGTVEKGLPDALEAVDAWLSDGTTPGRPAHLTIAGGMDAPTGAIVSESLARMTDKHGPIFRFEILDFITGREKNACYHQADLFLAPSHWESFGLTVAEALASGLPVVAASSDGVSGVLPDDYPYLSPVRDNAGFARNLAIAVEAIQKPEYPRFIDRLRGHFLECYTNTSFDRDIRALFARISKSCAADVSSPECPTPQYPITLSIYLADQNPKMGRSIGISRMTEVVIDSMRNRPGIRIRALASQSSIQTHAEGECRVLPWATKRWASRLLTDHLHPLAQLRDQPDVSYYPKGFLPLLHNICTPSVVTIHDTIVQYYADHYPRWRTHLEYRYWEQMLRHTLTNADHIMTVSQTSKRHIEEFIASHGIPEKEITVTYEPCLYESIPQPENPVKQDYILHLASREPHKRTAWLVEFWLAPDNAHLPPLHLVGTLPDAWVARVAGSHRVRLLPFLDDDRLQAEFNAAKAVVLPSEIEGFGLPAIEAYYLGTPVCFVKDTSVEEVLGVATAAGGFHLDDPESLNRAITEALALPADEIRRIGLKLRETYAAAKVVDRMCEVFAAARGAGGA